MLTELIVSIAGGVIGGLIVCGLLYIFRWKRGG